MPQATHRDSSVPKGIDKHHWIKCHLKTKLLLQFYDHPCFIKEKAYASEESGILFKLQTSVYLFIYLFIYLFVPGVTP